MEEALIARLLADSAVAALVGNRINWVLQLQGRAMPALTLTVISPAADYTYEGRDGLRQSRVQIDAFGATFGAAKAVLRAAMAALEPSATFAGVRFQGGFITSERDDGELVGSEYVYRSSTDLTLWHS